MHICRVTALKTELFEDGACIISFLKTPATSIMPGTWQHLIYICECLMLEDEAKMLFRCSMVHNQKRMIFFFFNGCLVVSFIAVLWKSAMAAERRGMINAACGGHGTHYILIYHGKSFPELQLENLVLKFPHLAHSIVFSNSSVLSSLSPFWAFFIHYIIRRLKFNDSKSEGSREECFP